ncbi:MAG: DUF2608 domain-containing protein [Chlamydiae bacterium]|nr:DUF2608 domain-containing protein [Chlamydiota bacterium]
MLYLNNLKNWIFGFVKASGFNDRKWVHISNIDPLTIFESQDLSLKPKTNFSSCLGIKHLIFCLFGFFYFCSLRADITAIDSFENLTPQVENLLTQNKPTEILVLFDINYTLIQVDLPPLYVPNIRKHTKIMHNLIDPLSKEKKDILFSLATKENPQMLVEPSIPTVLSNLQKQNIKLLALSSTLSGELGENIKSDEWYYQNLKNFNVSFENSFPNIEHLVFKDLPFYCNSYPLFYKGIILTNKCSKGKVLIAFFKLANYTPRVVVMLDNKPENLSEVQQELKLFDPSIKFIGLQYEKGSNYAPQDIDETSFKNWWQSRIEKLIQNGNNLKAK